MFPAQVCVWDEGDRMPAEPMGHWDEGIDAATVLSDIKQRLGLFPGEGQLMFAQPKQGLGEVGSNDRLVLANEITYFFKAPGNCSAHDLCTTPLPSQTDCVTARHTTGGLMMLKTVDESPDLRKQVQQCQQRLPRQPRVHKQPEVEHDLQTATTEDGLVQALLHGGLRPVNNVIRRFSRKSQRLYEAYWSGMRASITPSSSSQYSSSQYSGSSWASGSRCNSESGSMSSSRATSQEDMDDTAAAAAVPSTVGGDSPPFAYRVGMDPFTLDTDVDQVNKTMRDQMTGLTKQIPVPKVSLSPNFHFHASARGWYQEQQSLQASGVSHTIISRSIFASCLPLNSPQTSTATGTLAQSAATAAATPSAAAASFLVAASAASSSAAAAAETLSAAMSEGLALTDRMITLVTGVMKPASVMCQAFGMKDSGQFLRVAACALEQDRKLFSLAARCQQRDKIALSIVNEAVGHAFFTGTELFVITCYSVLWIGVLDKVEEVVGADGKIGLAAAVTLSEAIFGKDAGPDTATARAAYLWLADQTFAKPYHIRQIAKPDVLSASDTAAVNQQGGTGSDDDGDGGDGGDGGDPRRNSGDQQQQVQFHMQMLPQHQHQFQYHQQQCMQSQMHMVPQQKQQQQPPSSHHQMPMHDKLPNLPYQYFTYQHLQLRCLIADKKTSQVFNGTFLGQEVIIKTLSLHWRPAGGHLYEAFMYNVLHDLQLSGVLCKLLGHGEYYGLRYCMILEPALGSPLSQLPQYSPSVQQAVLAAVAKIHQRDVIHDDLHQDNIFVQLVPGAPPRVTVIDLGRARPEDSAGEKREEMEKLQQMLGRSAHK